MRPKLVGLLAGAVVLETLWLAGLGDAQTAAQRTGPTAEPQQAELILYNGKIVTVDDPSTNSSPGTIVQALAVRGSKILATGTTAQIRAMAGPNTRQIDLKGRTMMPSLMLTHEHPTDWAWTEPEALKRALPKDTDYLMIRWLEGTAEQQLAGWEQALQKAAAEAKPGQWIWLSFAWGPNYEYADVLSKEFRKTVTRAKIDRIAPNNPVRVKNSWPLDAVENTKGVEELKRVYPNIELPANRFVEPDVILRGRTPVLADILKAEMELWAAQGITLVGSSPYAPGNLHALTYLDRRGEMPARFAWGYTGPDFHPETVKYMTALVGHGSDNLWNIGAWDQSGGSCTTIEARPEVKSRESCSFAPGSPGRATLDLIIREGGRIATLHTGGDKDIDYLMDAIELTSKEAGLTLEGIRAKRHAFDHASGAPRPDQIPRIKRLGMMVSMINTTLWETHRGAVARAVDYGVEYSRWIIPRKSVTDAGIMSTMEIDRPLPHKIFTLIKAGITRYHEKAQRTFAPEEGTDRVNQLKALTTWAAYYVLRENLLGSLESGKLADFIVLDQDYLTIPVADIPKIRVLMTVVGGRTIHLMPELAQEIGMPAVGPATWPTKPLENYYSRPELATRAGQL